MTEPNEGDRTSGYAYVWEFVVPAVRRAEFEHEYGVDGRWVTLFRSAPGYLGTILLHDEAMPGRYLTVDRWRSAADYRAFRTDFAVQYAALDRECKGLTLAERSIGNFRHIGA